jgi:hypothetical protein
MGPTQPDAVDRDLLDKFAAWKRANPAEAEGLEPWEILLLAFLDAPVAWFGTHGLPLPNFEPRVGIKTIGLLREAYPEPVEHAWACDGVYQDLCDRGLVDPGRLKPLQRDVASSQLLAPGKQLLRDVRG